VKKYALVILLAIAAARADQPIQLDASAKRALIQHALSLKRGDPYQVVIDRLGRPTMDQSIGVKPNKFLVRTLKYYVVKSAGTFNETTDEHIDIYLDKSDRVKSVYLKVEVE
jgi:hypothetical protein